MWLASSNVKNFQWNRTKLKIVLYKIGAYKRKLVIASQVHIGKNYSQKRRFRIWWLNENTFWEYFFKKARRSMKFWLKARLFQFWSSIGQNKGGARGLFGPSCSIKTMTMQIGGFEARSKILPMKSVTWNDDLVLLSIRNTAMLDFIFLNVRKPSWSKLNNNKTRLGKQKSKKMSYCCIIFSL